MSRTDRPGVLAWASLAVVYVVWGSTFLAIRIGIRAVPPATFAAVRFLIAGLILCALAARTASPAVRAADRPGKREWFGCAVVGILLPCVGNGGVSIAQEHLDTGLAAVLAATIPMWVVVISAVWARRMLPAVHVVGLVCGLAGVGILATGGHTSGSAGSVVIILVSTLGWALGSVLAGRVRLPRRVMLASGMQMLVGGVALLVVAAVRGEFAHLHLDAVRGNTWLALGWLVLAGSVLAYSAYGYALTHLPLTTVATYAYVNPVVAVFLGEVFLAERLTGSQVVGALVVVAAVALTVRAPREPAVADLP